jgi:hypothetical protein
MATVEKRSLRIGQSKTVLPTSLVVTNSKGSLLEQPNTMSALIQADRPPEQHWRLVSAAVHSPFIGHLE